MNIGYNAQKANVMIENICNGYSTLGGKIQQAWPSVRETLIKEWVGPDEQDFEKKLVEKICNLYVSAQALAEQCTKQIAQSVDSWVEFQKSNTMDGSVIEDSAIAGIIATIKEFLFGSPRLAKRDNIILFVPTVLGNDRGLASGTSAETIKTAVNDYVTSIKSACNNIFDGVDVNSAFFGADQVKAIQGYIDEVEIAIGAVMSAVKDFYDMLDSLAGSSYTSADTSVASNFDTSKTSVQTSVESMGNSRWV